MSGTPEWMDDKGKIIEHKYCQCFLEQHPLLSKGEDFFTTEGIVTDKDRLLRDVFDDIKEHLTGGLVTKAKNLLEAIRMECYDRGELEKHQDRVFLANGTLFLDGRFVAEKGFCLNRLPICYNPKAPQPEVWLRFLSELLEPEDILTLQEFMGYCLIPCTRGQVMLLIKGNGGEGKSRIGVVMHTLFGANAKNGSIDKVENSAFARADLQHVLVMVDDDTKMEALSSTHYVKSIITAETPMDLERKKEQSFQGDMYVRFMAFSNGDLEALYDKSEGFFRRQLVLQTRRKPPDRVDDPFLSDKLKQEAEGIFLWCLDGLKRLQANSYRFTVSQRAAENKEHAKEFFAYALEFIQKKQSSETIISAVVHVDEKTPHMHLCFVPLTAGGRLSAKDIVGNKKKLTQWQDEFWKYMVKKYPDFERGESASETGRTHIPPRLFKEAVRLNRQKDKITRLLSEITPLNAKKKSAEIESILTDYIPSVEKLMTRMKKANSAVKELKKEIAALEQELDGSKASVQRQLELARKLQEFEALQQTVQELEGEIAAIPPEIREKYNTKTERKETIALE